MPRTTGVLRSSSSRNSVAWAVRKKIQLCRVAVVMASSVSPESSKKDGVPIRPATDPAQGGGSPALFTEEALQRLEAGLRAQREQQGGRRFREPDAAASLPRNSSALRDRLSGNPQIEPMSENAPLAAGADQFEIRNEEPVPLPSWRWRKAALVLCALLLVVGAATLGVSLKARTGGSAPVNIEGRGRTASAGPNKDEPRQQTTHAVRSSASTPSPPPLAPAPPNQQPVEAQGPATPAASGTSAPPNERPAEANGPATPSASGTPAPPKQQAVEAQGSAMPAAAGTPAAKPQCNISACRRFYRSFRASDCTFEPYHGRRRICTR